MPRTSRRRAGCCAPAGGQGHIVAKIERAEAVTNIRAIIDASDVIMVARGDLAVEVGYASMTGLQKGLIRLARARNKVCITRHADARIDDQLAVADARRGLGRRERRHGRHRRRHALGRDGRRQIPVRAVRTMAELCVGAEKHETFRRAANYRLEDVFAHVDEAIAMAVMYVANHLDVTAIIALTESGSTPLWMSRVRSDIPVFAFTRHEATLRRVSLYRGVYAVAFDEVVTDDAVVTHEPRSSTRCSKMGAVTPGDLVVLTMGQKGVAGRTNALQILTVPGAARRLASA